MPEKYVIKHYEDVPIFEKVVFAILSFAMYKLINYLSNKINNKVKEKPIFSTHHFDSNKTTYHFIDGHKNGCQTIHQLTDLEVISLIESGKMFWNI